MRCKSCNSVMDTIHMVEIDSHVHFEELCSSCRYVAFEEWDYAEDHEFMFHNITEGVTPKLKTPY